MRIAKWTVLWLFVTAPFLLAQSSAAPTPTAPPDQAADSSRTTPSAPKPSPHHKPKVPKAPPPLVLPPLPSGPLSQLPMDQIPATPAKVSYNGGLLTISAQNSTLGEILRDVRKLTGASIEVPANGAGERVVTHLGPGSPRDVLVSLLNGSSFNYVMIGSTSDPAAVASVILTPKESLAGQPQTSVASAYEQNPGARPLMPNRFGPGGVAQTVVPMPGNGVAPPEDGEAADDQEAAEEPAADDQGQPEQPVQPDTPTANVAPQQPQTDPNQPNAGPKTPEQILDMLRRAQQPGAATNPQPPPPQQ